MNTIAKNIHSNIEEILRKNYLDNCEHALTIESQYMIDIIRLTESRKKVKTDQLEEEKELCELRSELNVKIENIWILPDQISFSSVNESLKNELEAYLATLEINISETQNRDRFFGLQKDGFIVRIKKGLKRSAFRASNIPNDMLNIFRKEKIIKGFWNHEIALQSLAKRHYQCLLIADLKKVTDLFFKELTAQYREIKNWEQSLESTDESEERTFIDPEEFKKTLLKRINEALAVVLKERTVAFLDEYEKAGTIELKNKWLSDSTINNSLNSAQDKWGKNYLEWRNTIYALFEEWKSDLSIYSLIHNSRLGFELYKAAQANKLSEYIDPDIVAIKAVLQDAKGAIEGQNEDLLKSLKKINYTSGKKLDKELVPSLSEKLSNQGIIRLLNKLEIGIGQSVEEMSSEHVIVKSDLYDAPMKTSELYQVSLHELITFEILASFNEDVQEAKSKLLNKLTSLAQTVNDVDHIFTYSIASCIEGLEQRKNIEEVLEIALDGIERTSARLDDIRTQLETVLLDTATNLKSSIDKFCQDVLGLTYNENISELRLRITKAKATRQAEEVRAQLSEKIGKGIANFSGVLSAKYHWAILAFTSLRERFILTAVKPVLSKQVSDFLIESQQSMEKLPLIYCRIFQIEPLEDLELFEGRENEFKVFKSAFENWQKGRFAATSILGEKWGGLTTFLNYVIKQSKLALPTHRIVAKGNIYHGDQLLDVIKTAVKNSEVQSVEALVEFFNSGQKRIIIIEDLQNLYLRKVGGFDALETLFALISETSKNVFWVCSTTLYTWDFLCKTLKINEFFSYVIEMEHLTKSQIVDLIWKRNRISGFNVEFEIDAELEKKKKFTKLDAEAQQNVLKEDFFSALNDFAKSNVSLALVFWLLSAKKVSDNVITIGEFEPPNLNFLKVLSMDKIYVLHSLILHDGLSIVQLSEVLHVTISQAQMNILALYEDGIVTKKEQQYMVNPMVYRNSIGLLKAKNLIH